MIVTKIFFYTSVFLSARNDYRLLFHLKICFKLTNSELSPTFPYPFKCSGEEKKVQKTIFILAFTNQLYVSDINCPVKSNTVPYFILIFTIYHAIWTKLQNPPLWENLHITLITVKYPSINPAFSLLRLFGDFSSTSL